jgi:outer membrane protein W
MQRVNQLTILILLLAVLLLIYTKNAYAQPFSVRTSVGVVDLPFHDWSSIYGNLSNSFYTKNNPNLYYSLSIHYDLYSNHSINIGTELIRSTASSSGPTVTIDWKFQGIPITLGYEYSAFRFNHYFTPTFGVGISYFMSEVDAHDNFFNQTLKRHGNGYGIHASLGLKSELTQRVGMISQLRYRYSNGMAFTDSKGDIKVEFTGFDFSTGLCWTF